MGAKIATYSFIPKANEQIDAVITVKDELRSMIFGIVKDCEGRVIKDAVVKLLIAADFNNKCWLKPLTHTFTDECGQFFFGPLIPGKKYVIKVWFNDVKICPPHDDHNTDEICMGLAENTCAEINNHMNDNDTADLKSNTLNYESINNLEHLEADDEDEEVDNCTYNKKENNEEKADVPYSKKNPSKSQGSFKGFIRQ